MTGYNAFEVLLEGLSSRDLKHIGAGTATGATIGALASSEVTVAQRRLDKAKRSMDSKKIEQAKEELKHARLRGAARYGAYGGAIGYARGKSSRPQSSKYVGTVHHPNGQIYDVEYTPVE